VSLVSFRSRSVTVTMSRPVLKAMRVPSRLHVGELAALRDNESRGRSDDRGEKCEVHATAANRP
jgi:hypothetical protein